MQFIVFDHFNLKQMTHKEYRFFLEADRIIAGRPVNTFKRRIRLFFAPQYIERFMFLLRKYEYLYDKKGIFNKLSLFITRYRYNKVSLKLGFSLGPNVFGPGLYIPHYGTIVVNANTKIGANCVLHTSTCIGGSEPKTIGDNVYIGTGAIILGNITLADNVTISANSLVDKSFLESNILVGGAPAKVIKERKAWFECDDHQRCAAAVKEIEELRKSMFGAKSLLWISNLVVFSLDINSACLL